MAAARAARGANKALARLKARTAVRSQRLS
jgi:hypothetical protein